MLHLSSSLASQTTFLANLEPFWNLHLNFMRKEFMSDVESKEKIQNNQNVEKYKLIFLIVQE